MSEHISVSVGSLYPGAVPPIGSRKTSATTSAGSAGTAAFHKMLQSKLLKFSHHAEARLQQRGIELKPEQLQKLENAIDKAAAKGAKDSLVIFQDMAMIVNVSNRTVITAMDHASMKENVFTQIDSAVFVT
ncbi:TIGR02530 family flagellar biosynthesis protein [Paenibacillus turpanensis]|uniref:TIGR02530 family flagellar biosynthesis protein n=1 Tax=Paenibacillus turpanensis TaxID=2689078 RepID=UPI001408D5F0